MLTMTQTEIDKFLQAPRHAIVGTIGADGRAHLSPVWYLYESNRLYITLGTDAAKYRNLQRDPRISVCVDAGHPDARAVMLYGTAGFVAKGEPMEEEMFWRIVRHYHNTDEAAQRYGDSVRGRPMVLVVVHLEKIISQDFN